MNESDNASTPGPGHDAEPEPRLVLVKGDQRWVFRCSAGHEAAVLGRLQRLARDERSPVSWFDAAVLSHQLGERMRRRLRNKPTGRD